MGLDELAASGGSPPADAGVLERKLHSGATWFYWIAGLSLVNSVAQSLGSAVSFLAGLGITQVFDGVMAALARGEDAWPGAFLRAVALAFDLFVAAFFVLLAWQAGKRSRWAFILGMVVYGLDGLILVMVRDWFGFAFHGFALYGIWAGYSSLKQLQAVEALRGDQPVEPGAGTVSALLP